MCASFWILPSSFPSGSYSSFLCFFYADLCLTKFLPLHSHCFAASGILATSLYPRTPSTSTNSRTAQSDSVPLMVPVVPWAREATVHSEAINTVPRTQIPVAMGCTPWPSRQGGHRGKPEHQGTVTLVGPSWGYCKFHKMAPTPNLGSWQCLARQWLWCQWLYQKCLGHLTLNALSGDIIHTYTCLPTHPHTWSLIHVLTLSWIFRLITLWFSSKIGLGLRVSGQSFQLLCSHLGPPFLLVSVLCLTKFFATAHKYNCDLNSS